MTLHKVVFFLKSTTWHTAKTKAVPAFNEKQTNIEKLHKNNKYMNFISQQVELAQMK